MHYLVQHLRRKPALRYIGSVLFLVAFALIGVKFLLLSHAANPSLVGDLNNDGVVNDADLSILRSNWRQAGANGMGDLNADSTVNIFDLSIMLSHMGQNSSAVGAPTPAGVACTSTLNPGADVNAALSSASPGDVVCLNSGSWSAITLTSIAPAAPGVTLAAAPGQTVEVPGFTINGANTQNLTVEGFNITQPSANGNDNGIQLFCGISGGVTLKHNTIENQPNGMGLYAYADYCGGGHTQSGVTFEYNQVDHVGTGIQVNGGAPEELNWTISHNVIGPGINYQGYGHYIEVGGVSGLTVNNNAFEGPQYWNVDQDQTSHLNALHVFGEGINVTFNNNIIWHSEARGQAVLMQDSPLDNITAENNLDVEDPLCETDSNCYNHPFEIEAAHGLTFEHNTSVNGAWGISLGRVISGDTYTDPQGIAVEYNIDVPLSGDSGTAADNYSLLTCLSTCTAQDNVSSDASANTVLGGTGNAANWVPSWVTTSWTPIDGPGYSPPPSGYYQPVGLGISAGYQGVIGP